MTTATDRTESIETTADFESSLTIAAPAEKVLAALRSTEAISSWWCPATGSALPGGILDMASKSGSRMLEMRVDPTVDGRVSWSVQDAPLTPEWVGTTVTFVAEDAPGGALLRFRHQGLTPQCDCFDMCQEGWISALGRLTSFVETGEDAYARDSFHAVKSIAASPETVLDALRSTEGVTSWWGPTTGSADVGGTLEVSFLGGRQRIVLRVLPALPGRVSWAVVTAPLTPDWDGTTIFFDVTEAGDGSMLYFGHQGLTPELECYDMCHEGWTHFLGSLVSYAETGTGDPHTEG